MEIQRLIRKVGGIAFISLIVAALETPSRTYAGPFGRWGAEVRYTDGNNVGVVCIYHFTLLTRESIYCTFLILFLIVTALFLVGINNLFFLVTQH
jgi:hypothetical protein